MDISILIVFAYYSHLTNFSQAIFELGNIMNVIVALLLIHISIHIGWLAEWSLVKFNSLQKNSSSVHKISISKQIQIEDLKKLDLVDYKSVKVHFSKEFESLFNEIDALVDYSKTEKLYYFLDKMDFSHKELSDILNVSVRTVETNFYRLRKKIQKQPF
jgi:predicted nucleotidyltransferase